MEEDFRIVLEARTQYFGRRLAQRRKACGLTLQDLSVATGLSVSYLNNLEKAFQRRPTCPTIPGDETLARIAKALDQSFFEVNSWLGRAPKYFDETFWNKMLAAGYKNESAWYLQAAILNLIPKAIEEQKQSEKESNRRHKADFDALGLKEDDGL